MPTKADKQTRRVQIRAMDERMTRFCQLYSLLVNPSPSDRAKAAIEAGYNEGSAGNVSRQLLAKPKVVAEVARLKSTRESISLLVIQRKLIVLEEENRLLGNMSEVRECIKLQGQTIGAFTDVLQVDTNKLQRVDEIEQREGVRLARLMIEHSFEPGLPQLSAQSIDATAQVIDHAQATDPASRGQPTPDDTAGDRGGHQGDGEADAGIQAGAETAAKPPANPPKTESHRQRRAREQAERIAKGRYDSPAQQALRAARQAYYANIDRTDGQSTTNSTQTNEGQGGANPPRAAGPSHDNPHPSVSDFGIESSLAVPAQPTEDSPGFAGRPVDDDLVQDPVSGPSAHESVPGADLEVC